MERQKDKLEYPWPAMFESCIGSLYSKVTFLHLFYFIVRLFYSQISWLAAFSAQDTRRHAVVHYITDYRSTLVCSTVTR